MVYACLNESVCIFLSGGMCMCLREGVCMCLSGGVSQCITIYCACMIEYIKYWWANRRKMLGGPVNRLYMSLNN